MQYRCTFPRSLCVLSCVGETDGTGRGHGKAHGLLRHLGLHPQNRLRLREVQHPTQGCSRTLQRLASECDQVRASYWHRNGSNRKSDEILFAVHRIAIPAVPTASCLIVGLPESSCVIVLLALKL